MHVSIYVFDGRTSTPYREDDSALPLNVYGTAKLAGERFIQALRTSGLYGSHPCRGKGGNFVDLMLRLGLRDRPASLTLLPGILMMVPGSLGFRGLDSFLSHDVVSGVAAGFQMVLIAVALVTGLFLANIVVPPRKLL